MSGITTVDGASADARYTEAPGALPLLGHFHTLHRDPLAFMDSLRSQGDLVRIKLGPSRPVVICHPHLAHQVLTDLRTFDRTGVVYKRVRAASGDGREDQSAARPVRGRLRPPTTSRRPRPSLFASTLTPKSS
jgi:hypothetical protein